MATEAELILKLTDQTQAGFASIQANLKQLQQQAQKTQDVTKGFGESLSGMASKLGAWASGFITVKAASDLLISSLRAQGEQEASINKLNLALANQGRLTQETSKALIDYADQLQATTTFADDVVISAEAMLASFGMNEEQIKRTTKAAADYAAATGKDLLQVTDALGKAFAGNTSTLSKWGVQVDENKSKSQQFDDALGQLEQRFSGSAEAAATTFGGSMEQLKNAFGEVQEGLGKLIGTMLDSQQGFNIAVEGANRFANFLKTDMVVAFSEVRAQFAEMLAFIFDAVAKWAGLLDDIAGKIASISPRIAADFRAFTGLDTTKLKAVAEDQRKLAESIRLQGDQAAMSAGKVLDFSKSQHTLQKSTTDAHKAITVSFEEMMATRREAEQEEQRQIDEAVAFNLRQTEILEEFNKSVQESLEEEIAIRKDVAETEAELVKEAEQQFQDMIGSVHELGGSFEFLGGVVGGVFGGILKMAGQVTHAVGDIGQGIHQIQGAGGGLGGMLSKLSGGLAVAGAAFSIGKAIFGGIKKLFGGGGKEKAAEEAKKAEEAAKKAAEAQQKRIEGLKTAVGGLDMMTKAFAQSLERAGTATATNQAAFGRLGSFAVATFAGLVRETGDVIGALQQMGPTLDTLQSTMSEFGFTAGAAFSRLLQLRAIVTANEDVANSISGLNQLMKGLGEAGLATGQILLDMGAQARANFDELIARGVDAEAAMSLMQPTLQELWEQHKKLGVQYDAETQALLDQAEQQGLVGEQFMSVNEQMLEVLKILVETLGGELPAAMRRMGDTAEEQFGRMGTAAREAGGVTGAPGGFEQFGDAPGFAGGGVIRANPPHGTLIRAGESGDEIILNKRQFQMLQGGKGGGGDVFLDGRKVGKVLDRRAEGGDRSIKSPLRRAR